MNKRAIFQFVEEWKLIDRFLAISFLVLAKLLIADVDGLSNNFKEMNVELRTLNSTMIRVVTDIGHQKKDIIRNENSIEKNRDKIEHLYQKDWVK